MVKRFKLDTSDVEDMLTRRLVNHHRKILKNAMQIIALEVDAYGKQNAPWRDRTGVARMLTSAKFTTKGDKLYITMGIGKLSGLNFKPLYYGVFLEYANGGKYKIVKPMDYKARNDLGAAMRAMGYKI